MRSADADNYTKSVNAHNYTTRAKATGRKARPLNADPRGKEVRRWAARGAESYCCCPDGFFFCAEAFCVDAEAFCPEPEGAWRTSPHGAGAFWAGILLVAAL